MTPFFFPFYSPPSFFFLSSLLLTHFPYHVSPSFPFVISPLHVCRFLSPPLFSIPLFLLFCPLLVLLRLALFFLSFTDSPSIPLFPFLSSLPLVLFLLSCHLSPMRPSFLSASFPISFPCFPLLLLSLLLFFPCFSSTLYLPLHLMSHFLDSPCTPLLFLSSPLPSSFLVFNILSLFLISFPCPFCHLIHPLLPFLCFFFPCPSSSLGISSFSFLVCPLPPSFSSSSPSLSPLVSLSLLSFILLSSFLAL